MQIYNWNGVYQTVRGYIISEYDSGKEMSIIIKDVMDAVTMGLEDGIREQERKEEENV